MLDRDDLAGVADVCQLCATPASTATRGRARRGQHAVAVLLRLRLEPFRRTASTPRRRLMSPCRQHLRALDGQLDLRPVAMMITSASAGSAAEHVAAGRHPRRWCPREPGRPAGSGSGRWAHWWPRARGWCARRRPSRSGRPGAPPPAVQDRPQRREMLDGLVGRTVLAEPIESWVQM